MADLAGEFRITSKMKFTIFVMLLLVAVTALRADTITVTNTNDSGPGSLRTALTIANHGDTIEFAVTGTITLTSGELLVDKRITISGPGVDNLAVSGNAKSRVLYVGPVTTVTISGLTIRNGNAPTDFGGGIYNDHSTLVINTCSVTGNSADLGGGIYNHGASGSASITVNNSTFSNNDDAGGFLTGPGDQINTDPMLGPLQDNGGSTFTHELLNGSPAIDSGDPNFTPPPFYDQRGPDFYRVRNDRSDIGSFEVQAGSTPPPTPRPTPSPRSRPSPRTRPTPPPHLTPVPPPPSPRPTPWPRP